MKQYQQRLWFVVIASMTLASWGCGGAMESALCDERGLPKAQPGDLPSLEAAASAAWAERKDPAKLVEAIDNFRKAVATAPAKTENYVKLAKALYFWGDGYLRLDEKDEEMLKAFEEAIKYTERALRIQNSEFTLSECSGDPFTDTAKTIRRSDIPAIYWYAVALGKYGLAKSIVLVLNNKDKIYEMMKTIQRLDPAYHHGAADRYLGAFFTKIPFPKGDAAKSHRHFKRAIKRSPNYLATRVLMAKMLASKLSDGRKVFKEQLEYVINAPVDVMPELVPEHIIEKRKAKELLEEIDDRFPQE
jgi:tetratricopeptide (TPR) repeat protein